MTLCGFEIAPGEKRRVKLPVPGGEPLEAWLLCGTHPGKNAGGHSWCAWLRICQNSGSEKIDRNIGLRCALRPSYSAAAGQSQRIFLQG